MRSSSGHFLFGADDAQRDHADDDDDEDDGKDDNEEYDDDDDDEDGDHDDGSNGVCGHFPKMTPQMPMISAAATLMAMALRVAVPVICGHALCQQQEIIL